MALSKRVLTLTKWLYWILMTMLHLYICYILFTINHAIVGVLWLILGFILLYVMYFVYFPPGDPGTVWPPYIRSCPDYLTMIAPNACVDYVGLNTMLKKSDPAHPPLPTERSHVFDSSGSNTEKANRTIQYGLSWEGIA
jgi:hypothetical protein